MVATPLLGSGARGAPLVPAARVLAQSAAEVLGEAGGGGGAGEEAAAAAAMPAAAVSLRIVLNPASMAKDVAVVEAAVEEVLRGA